MATHATQSATDNGWIGRPPQGSLVRRKFAAALNELAKAKNVTPIQFARDLFGQSPTKTTPYNHSLVSLWFKGDKFPNAASAAKIATYFNVPISRLLTTDAPLPANTKTRAAAQQKKTQSKPGPKPGTPRGPYQPRKAPSDIPPDITPALALPKDAPPLTFNIADYKSDPRFATVTVEGVTDIDTALSIVALILRKRRDAAAS